ncbi:CocE/NonD family hydrolase [Undibacterium fentianense]|uniref:CocE/NonD family hydrolase n=1 Tax=Undibacterium fentianense TaxID=2828728 RepID=UPI002E35757B|nr:CocE/NonD family hydrolase [Undibacterium fentianense]
MYAQQVENPIDLGADYELNDKLFFNTADGARLSGMLLKKKNLSTPVPTILQFTIYARPQERDLQTLKDIADRGYVGVIAYSRGKYLSEEAIKPYETDGADARTVIDWISKQTWSDGQVAMMGGSYNGFTQWAASKQLHPALKTIVPIVANRPGMGLPMENNIFINPNYQWAFYVGNQRLLDNKTNDDRQRFREMQFNWWYSGRPYREIDQVDGTSNPWLQTWLQHPSYDRYWQDMAPYGKEFAQITIPVLTIDGYFNDSQVSSLDYLRQHLQHNPQAEHYLVIGPYGHFGAQRGGEKKLNELDIHPAALFDINALTFAWMDYVLKGKQKPSFLKDRVNYFPVGESQWRHAPSLSAMSDHMLRLYLTPDTKHKQHRLTPTLEIQQNYVEQIVDFADRKNSNNDYYPYPILRNNIDRSNGLIFVSDPFKEDILLNGAFSGELIASINKRDFDFGVTLYELTPEGHYFHLGYVIDRASYLHDPSQRQLLKPNQVTRLPLTQTKLISKRLHKGSRIVVYLNVNKNAFSQINYGTGKDVSDESIGDAKRKLVVKWFAGSYVNLQLMLLHEDP